jgi:hypothetical protein
MTGTRRGPLKLADLVPALPMVELLNGKEIQLVPLTARGYELFLSIQEAMRGVEMGLDTDDAVDMVKKIDEVLGIVLPTATPDDLASFGVRTDIKLGVIMSAAGAVDEVLSSLRAETNTDSSGNG